MKKSATQNHERSCAPTSWGAVPVGVGNLHTEDSQYDDNNTQEYMSEHIDAVAEGES